MHATTPQPHDRPILPVVRPDLTLANSAVAGRLEILGNQGISIANIDCDEQGRDAFAAVWPLLDGTRYPEQIAEATGLSEKVVAELVNGLYEAGCVANLSDAVDPDGNLDRGYLGALTCWSMYTSQPGLVLQRLRRARVLLHDESSAFGGEVVEQLNRCGIGSILRAGAHVSPDDAALPLREDGDTRSRPSAVAGPHAELSGIGRRPGIAISESPDTFPADLALAVSFDTDVLRRLNQQYLNRRIPFIPVHATGLEFQLGPLVMPHQSACLECYYQRCTDSGAWPAPNSSAALRGRVSGLPPLLSAMAAEVAVYAVSALARLEVEHPLTDCVIRVFTSGPSRQRIAILRRPRCPACGRHTQVPEGAAVCYGEHLL